MNALLASWQNLSLGLERPLHKQISESNCTSYSEKGLVAQTHIFNTIKPLLVLTSSPSRTNTNFNTLQCSFPKPPLKQPLSHPFPRTTPIPPSLLSHNRKSFGASAMAPARLRSLVGRAQRPFSNEIPTVGTKGNVMISREILENRPPRIEIDLSRSSRGV